MSRMSRKACGRRRVSDCDGRRKRPSVAFQAGAVRPQVLPAFLKRKVGQKNLNLYARRFEYSNRRACSAFPKSLKRALFVSRKAYKGRFNVTFSLVRKSNQKVHQRAAALWTPGGAVQNSERGSYLLKRKLYAY